MMFHAILILLVSIVGLVVWLLFQSYPRPKSRSFNASELLEDVSNNRLLTIQGDVAFCYRLQLPEVRSLSEDQYDRLNEIWRVALKDLPQGTIILRSDRYDRQLFDASAMPENSYIQREEKAFAAGRMQTCDMSCLFVVFTGFRATRDPRSQNPFVPLTHAAFCSEDQEYVRFTRAVDSMYLQFQGSGIIGIEPFGEEEVREYTRYFFNGFQTDYLTDVDAAGCDFRVGDRNVGAVSLEDRKSVV